MCCVFAVLATISVAAVSCSSDTQRFESNRFGIAEPASANEVTGSVPQKHPTIQSAPLPPPPRSAPATRPVVIGTAGGSRGMASYEPPPQAEVTGSVQQRRRAPKPGWSWDGGTPIMVQKGDTIDGLVARYGVPASAIAEANNIPNGTALKPGQHLVIPKYEATGSTTPRIASTRAARRRRRRSPRPPPAASQHVHVVAPGETLMALSRKYHKSLAELAKANNIAPRTMVKVGDRIVIPGVAPQAAAPKPRRPMAQSAAEAPRRRRRSPRSRPPPGRRRRAPRW